MSTKPMGENETWYRNLTRQNAAEMSTKPEMQVDRAELIRHVNQVADALCDERLRKAAALLAADAQASREVVYFCDYGHEGWGKIDASAVEQHRSWGMTVEKYYPHPQPQSVADDTLSTEKKTP